jgi:hypothetical protein
LASRAECPADRRGSGRFQCLDIGIAFDKGFEKNVVAPMVMQEWGIRLTRPKHVRHNRQFFYIDLYLFR